MKIATRYSGKNSEKFWKLINSLKDELDNEELYSLGCVLQDLEGHILDKLELALKKQK